MRHRPPLAALTATLLLLVAAHPSRAQTLDCQWQPAAGDPFPTHDDVVVGVAVANLTDDDGDGETGTQDFPDLAFVSFDRQVGGCCAADGVLRIVDGRCNPDGSMTTIATLGSTASDFMDNSSMVAIGNLDPASVSSERAPEIVAILKGGGTIAWKRTASDGSAWTELWRNASYPTWDLHTRRGAQPAIADLDGDGSAEVVVGNLALDGQTGALLWDGVVTSGGVGGVGNNGILGPVSSVGDVDLDGNLEVAAGNTLYDYDGSVLWTYPMSPTTFECGGYLPCDGFTAMGNFDEDSRGEIVIVRAGQVFLIDDDGQLLAPPIDLPGADCATNEGGPPLIADLDGDGRAEIGVAAADYYAVVDLGCVMPQSEPGCEPDNGIRWKMPADDCASRTTGSSAFEFWEGGVHVLYADESSFRIFLGSTGDVLFQDSSHDSNTRLEMPTVADIDGDGTPEILVPEAPLSGGNPGVRVYSWTLPAGFDALGARPIWNQHAYSVTNVTPDGQPTRPPRPENWLVPGLNNFRQNTTEPAYPPPIPALTSPARWLAAALLASIAIAATRRLRWRQRHARQVVDTARG